MLKFQCPICKRIFKLNQCLKLQKHKNTGRRTLGCKSRCCLSEFKRSNNLTVHQRIHRSLMIKAYHRVLKMKLVKKRGIKIKIDVTGREEKDKSMF